jgi:hypothetical protein
MQRSPAAVLLVLAALLVGCGDGEPAETVFTTPTGATGPTGGEGEKAVSDKTDADQPGAPDPGDPSYTALGSYWTELPASERIASAAEFIEDNPKDCEGVDPDDLERQTGLAFGLDFPLNVPVADAMLETCALIRDGG